MQLFSSKQNIWRLTKPMGYLIGVQTNKIAVNKMVAEAKRGFLINFSETPVSVINQLVPGSKGIALQHHSVGMADTLNGVCCGLHNTLSPEAKAIIAQTGDLNTAEVERQVKAGSFKASVEASMLAHVIFVCRKDDAPLQTTVKFVNKSVQHENVCLNDVSCDVLQVDNTAGVEVGELVEQPAVAHTHTHDSLDHNLSHACDACYSASDHTHTS
eukprot:GHVR01121774.1.p2 GENE.GHVR01121774.1~~GHVR01121774.1.p2  ORF type:complete len:214 (-),score=39.37 GHVR01121774.1:1039-1680(-)